MSNTTTIQTETRPDQLSGYHRAYHQYKQFWIDCLRLYDPLPDDLVHYLAKYPKESETDFTRRLKRLTQVNILAGCIDQYMSYLFAGDIQIKAGDEKHQAIVDEFRASCTLQGETFDEFLRELAAPSSALYGIGDVFVDKLFVDPNVVASEADAIAAGADRAYLYFVPALNRVNWRINLAGEYVEHWTQDIINTQLEAQYGVKDGQQWKQWTTEWVIDYNPDGTERQRRKNNYGFIPAVPLMPWERSQHFPREPIGKSMASDLIKFQINIINYISLIMDYHEGMNFPIWFWKQDTSNGDEAPTEGEFGGMGQNQGVTGYGKETDLKVVSPDPRGVESMTRHLDYLIDCAFNSVWLPTESSMSKSHTSGQSIRKSYTQLYNRLKRMARHLEQFTKRIFEKMLLVKGIDPKEANLKVQWNCNFDFESPITVIQEAQQLRQALQITGTDSISPTAEIAWIRKSVEAYLYGSDDMPQILAELDAAPAKMKEASDQQQALQQQKFQTNQQENTEFNASMKTQNSEGVD